MVLNILVLANSIFVDLYVNTVIVLLAMNIVGIIGLAILRIYYIRNSSSPQIAYLESEEPFVSIHLAICNEPPNIVLQTLNSFLGLTYKRFEVIIISNNTTNMESWKPIEEFAKKRSDRFKFFHYDKLDGYKAGALNIALKKTSQNADFIFTVDADYQLDPNALIIAVGSIQYSNVDLLQFPQDYRNTCHNTEGLQINYKHYFECYLSCMNNEKFGLPTGTLSLITMEIFRKGFKWPTTTITEDAHFGLELLCREFKIGYCNTSIGFGTMPTTVVDYNKQFKRWIFGNFQTLILMLKKREIKLSKKLRLFTMLSAWINLLAVPICTTFALVPLIVGNVHHLNSLIFIIFLSFSIHLFVQFYILYITAKQNIAVALRALLVHIGTLEIGSFYWLSYFKNRQKPFQRTNKYLVSSEIPAVFFLMPLLLFAIAIYVIAFGPKFVGFTFLLISIIALLGKCRLIYELYHSKFNLLKTILS